jgi:peptidoglycan hydrolase-like protein with peptidoglycan-binding domain
LSVDGEYGPLTKAGLVKALQTELNKQCGANLDVDGIYGNLTNNAVVNIQYGDQGNITKTLQGLLICNGYSTNGFDGLFGGGTKSAV